MALNSPSNVLLTKSRQNQNPNEAPFFAYPTANEPWTFLVIFPL